MFPNQFNPSQDAKLLKLRSQRPGWYGFSFVATDRRHGHYLLAYWLAS